MRSFIKWAGGKYQLLDEITDVIDSMRMEYDEFIYVEPFVGGGAVLFELLERCSNLKYAIINDMNSNLMDCYRVLADNNLYTRLKDRLRKMEDEYNECSDQKEYHRIVRNNYNSSVENDVVERSAMFIFLNKTSFNGIYRENSKGEFNVPWNKKSWVNLYDEDDLDRIHVSLNEKVIMLDGDYHCVSFAEDLARVEKCGLIYYLDPPYRPVSGTSSFVNYTKSGFNDEDQVGLGVFCDWIDMNERYFVLSNSKSDDFFEKLYSGYEIKKVGARRNINSVGSKRGEVDELIIYNKEIKNVGLF